MIDVRRSIASGALLVYLVTGAVAVLGGQATEPAHPASPPAAKPAAPKPPDISTIVERIQQRIDEEVVKPAAARTAAATRKPAARASDGSKPAAPADRRIRLLWRVALIWPDELVATQ